MDSTTTLAQPHTPRLRLHSRRPWAWALLAGLLLAAALVGRLVVRPKEREAKGPYRFDTAQVTRGPIQARVTASGTLSPLITVQVGAQVSGRIRSLHADFNSVVHKGQVVANIDPQLFVAAAEQARANLIAAQGNLAKAQAQLVDAQRTAGRQAQLLQRRLIAQADADTAETNVLVANGQVHAAEGTVAQARAALAQAQTNLAYTTITSPIDGVVISRNVDVGQTVAATLQSPTLFLIAQDLRRMQVDTSVAEADVGRLVAGARATFTVDAYPGTTFQGTIREVRNAPQTIQNVVTYDAVIDVDNSELKLKPGMTANVAVVFADVRNALRIPNAALRFRPPPDLAARSTEQPRPEGDERTVWTLAQDQARPLAVTPGVTDGTWTELARGALREGDVLITDAIRTGKGGPGSYGRVF